MWCYLSYSFISLKNAATCKAPRTMQIVHVSPQGWRTFLICECKINTFSWQKQIICNKFYLFYYNFLIKMTNIIKKSNKSQLFASDIINVSLPTMQNTIWYTEINGIYGHLYTKLYSIYWNTVYCGGVEFLITLHQLYIYTPCHKQRWCKGCIVGVE